MTTANEIADKIAAAVKAAAISGAETSIPAFGKFKLKETPERDARNPATGAMIKVR
ncbi:HU family DNA-binding protein [Rhizobium gallicum]|uniref:HU family DNA-binding protein n=1 Tax=Rhizobium gallicum TaxID=56730 RepID=UPI001EF82B23|nr:HU family DNA-binding protein [Rhizobium gallicum]ULJ74192.1 HU family DNA-binding protein [Rhizobium gallicum]